MLIAARNEADRIQETVAYIAGQDCPGPVEVLVVEAVPSGRYPRAAAMEAFFQPNRCRRIGVWPRGDQVRRTGGISETADSSKKTIQADSAAAPF